MTIAGADSAENGIFRISDQRSSAIAEIPINAQKKGRIPPEYSPFLFYNPFVRIHARNFSALTLCACKVAAKA